MRNVTISMLIVALLTVGVCVFAVNTVEDACVQTARMGIKAQRLCEAGQTEQALDGVGEMLRCWQAHEALLTAVLPHSAIGEVTQRILEAQADLRAGERQTFLTDMLLIGNLLERLRAEERLRLSNILSIC